MKISGYPVHDDADYAVLASWLFRFTKGRFGALTVFCKYRQLAIPASAQEKSYLMAVLGFLAARGLPTGKSETRSELFRGFAEAICGRSGWGWGAYFSEQPQQRQRNCLVSEAPKRQVEPTPASGLHSPAVPSSPRSLASAHLER